MKEEVEIRRHLEAARAEFLAWGAPGHQSVTGATTQVEVRGWCRALEWVLGKTAKNERPSRASGSNSAGDGLPSTIK